MVAPESAPAQGCGGSPERDRSRLPQQRQDIEEGLDRRASGIGQSEDVRPGLSFREGLSPGAGRRPLWSMETAVCSRR